jgi:hypothetical protein
MENIEIQKKRFLAGEITASEYDTIVNNLKQEIKSHEIKTLNNNNVIDNNTSEDDSYKVKVAIFIVIAFLVILVIGISKPKPTISDNIESEAYKVPEKTEKQKVIEDSIYRVESEQRMKIEMKEEAAFMRTKAGKIYKKHPEWSKDDCEKLAEGSIWIGMDIQMLKYKRGLPNSANPSNYGGGVTQWQWCWSDWTPSCFYDNDGDNKIDSYN